MAQLNSDNSYFVELDEFGNKIREKENFAFFQSEIKPSIGIGNGGKFLFDTRSIVVAYENNGEIFFHFSEDGGNSFSGKYSVCQSLRKKEINIKNCSGVLVSPIYQSEYFNHIYYFYLLFHAMKDNKFGTQIFRVTYNSGSVKYEFLGSIDDFKYTFIYRWQGIDIYPPTFSFYGFNSNENKFEFYECDVKLFNSFYDNCDYLNSIQASNEVDLNYKFVGEDDAVIYKGKTKRWLYIILPNHSPETPSITSGPSSGEIDKSYTFMAYTTDSDGDSVSYKYSWGDGSYSDWGSSTQSHKWNKDGSYCVKVQAKDTHGATSNWSSCKYITISSEHLKTGCSSDNLTACTSKTTCENSGGFWYNNVCHKEIIHTPVPTDHIINLDAKINSGGVSVGLDAVDGVLTKNEKLIFSVNFPIYEEAIDVYVAVFIPDLGAYFVTHDIKFIPFNGSIFIPYATNITIVPSISLEPISIHHPMLGCVLPAGKYTICSLVTPTGTDLAAWSIFNLPGELTCYSFTIECK